MLITRATLSCIADENQEPGQDDGREVQQPCPSTNVFNDHLQGIIDPSLVSLVKVIQEIHTGATDGNGGFATWQNNSALPVVSTTSIDEAPPNAADSTQGYVTMVDLIALLDREHSKHGTMPKEILSKPYLKKYESPTFLQYNGRKGSVVEHVSKFLDAMGAHIGDGDLCLHEFSKSLSDKAYTCEERITILDLHNTCKCTGEDLMVYVKRFRDLALDCYGGNVKSFLVEICINKMFPAYHVVLENIGINQFAGLLDAARRTTISVKAISTWKSTAKSTKKKTTAHTLAVFV
ncbi:hypothetical protein SLEP1_g12602 [Rubroshorea leprosula]|uniref:Retrotransposon gag domain-containing protein n=1 Tax=Rubroshorea leprosula TaxID=152421 RepID=A0AAV5IPF3_9ROSI|nr:hypothetical protein SLEP1_g12602 [Rubroshorea leprosula]